MIVLGHKRNSSTSEYGRRFAGIFPENRAVVYRKEGTEVDLIDFIELKHGTLLLGWWRSYGCTLCKKQIADWSAMGRKLEERNCKSVRMILVDTGYSHEAVAFPKEMD